jgi:hypothetical protein
MLYYRDRAYCNAKCADEHCFIKFTDKVKQGAEKSQLPLFLQDMSIGCKYFKEIKV